MTSKVDYNKRLFSKGSLRSVFHLARFYWVKKAIEEYSISTEKVIELGCFDGKLIDYLPKKPKKYKGFDANWESGLDLAKVKYKNNDSFEFNLARTPKEMNLHSFEKFDLAVCMETLEHIPPEIVCDYLKELANHLDGHILITVPNEKGIFFLLKRLLKPKGIEGDDYNFSIMDYINITLNRTNEVERDEHKGFDYEHLIYDVRKYFDIISVKGFSMNKVIPKFLSFGIGIIAKPKKIYKSL